MTGAPLDWIAAWWEDADGDGDLLLVDRTGGRVVTLVGSPALRVALDRARPVALIEDETETEEVAPWTP